MTLKLSKPHVCLASLFASRPDSRKFDGTTELIPGHYNTHTHDVAVVRTLLPSMHVDTINMMMYTSHTLSSNLSALSPIQLPIIDLFIFNSMDVSLFLDPLKVIPFPP